VKPSAGISAVGFPSNSNSSRVYLLAKLHLVDINMAKCQVWDRADVKREEGCCVDGATEGDYIHNQDH
jgi:hypothetical protein